jgi:Calcium-dependent channel, 7TM region, putative phosphate
VYASCLQVIRSSDLDFRSSWQSAMLPPLVSSSFGQCLVCMSLFPYSSYFNNNPFFFIVAFVGIISNVHQLCKTVSWLTWLCTLPSVVVSIISGILAPIVLAVLMVLLPIVLRLLTRFEGIPKRSGLELSLMTRFFIFQVIVSTVCCFVPLFL